MWKAGFQAGSSPVWMLHLMGFSAGDEWPLNAYLRLKGAFKADDNVCAYRISFYCVILDAWILRSASGEMLLAPRCVSRPGQGLRQDGWLATRD
jgi:hypothetical protein